MTSLVIFLALHFWCPLYLYELALDSWWEATFEFDFASVLMSFSPFQVFGVAFGEAFMWNLTLRAELVYLHILELFPLGSRQCCIIYSI